MKIKFNSQLKNFNDVKEGLIRKKIKKSMEKYFYKHFINLRKGDFNQVFKVCRKEITSKSKAITHNLFDIFYETIKDNIVWNIERPIGILIKDSLKESIRERHGASNRLMELTARSMTGVLVTGNGSVEWTNINVDIKDVNTKLDSIITILKGYKSED